MIRLFKSLRKNWQRFRALLRLPESGPQERQYLTDTIQSARDELLQCLREEVAGLRQQHLESCQALRTELRQCESRLQAALPTRNEWHAMLCSINPEARYMFTLPDGTLFEYPLRDVIGRALFMGQGFESAELACLKTHLKPGGVMFDVGANAGLFTLTAARLVGPGGHVYAFEPDPRQIALLERNIRLNRLTNVTVVPQAVGHRTGPVPFLLSEDSALNSLRENSHPDQKVHQVITVEMTTLDAFIARENIGRVDLVKIDVEGAEQWVLEGAHSLLQQEPAPRLIVEFCDATAAGFQSSGEALFRHIETLGYRLHEFSPQADGASRPASIKARYAYENLLALR